MWEDFFSLEPALLPFCSDVDAQSFAGLCLAQAARLVGGVGVDEVFDHYRIQEIIKRLDFENVANLAAAICQWSVETSPPLGPAAFHR